MQFWRDVTPRLPESWSTGRLFRRKSGSRRRRLPPAVMVEFKLFTLEIAIQCGHQRNGLLGQVKIFRVDLDANRLIADRFRRSDSRPGTHERVENRALSHRQQSADDDTHPLLRFEARVVRNELPRGRACARWE